MNLFDKKKELNGHSLRISCMRNLIYEVLLFENEIFSFDLLASICFGFIAVCMNRFD